MNNKKTALSLIFCFLVLALFGKVAIATGGTEQQIKQLSNTIGQQMTVFAQGMQQWGTGSMSDSAATTLFKTRLIPFSRKIKTNYKQLGNLGKHLSDKQTSKQLQYWAHRGMLIFSEWDQILSKMLQLNNNNNRVALQRFASQRIPLISQRTRQFIQGLAQATPKPTMANNPQTNNSQANLLQQQAQLQAQQQNLLIMSNINKIQHETSMAIINNMGTSSTADRYENGYFVGNW